MTEQPPATHVVAATHAEPAASRAPAGLAGPAGWELAVFNVARLRAPLDAAPNAEFVASLGPINALAEVSDGFVWRLVDDSGASAIYVQANEDPLEVVNLSVWRDVAAVKHFTYRSGHGNYVKRRHEWFEPSEAAPIVLWWIPAGTRPTVAEAYRRLARLRTEGPGPQAFGFARPFEPSC